MDKKSIEDIKAKLLEISGFVTKLDPSMRTAAFEILRPIYLDEDPIRRKHEAEAREDAPTELAAFIKTYEHKKPAENVMLLAAWLYSTYGVYPITAKEVKKLGDSCGLIVPARPDNTMRTAKKKGKSIFVQQGKGWKPTVCGETHLQETYNVKKGSKPFPKGDE